VNLHFELEPEDTLVVHLREGDEQTTLAVRPAAAGAASLQRALVQALAEGYGECFWPAVTGAQYWWIFKRDEERVETIAMWTRGGASLWEHVFRATDAAIFVRDRVRRDLAQLNLRPPPSPEA
jgi:hypothetical protein